MQLCALRAFQSTYLGTFHQRLNDMAGNHTRSSVFTGLCFNIIILIAGFTNKHPRGRIHLEKIIESRAETDFKRSEISCTCAIFDSCLFKHFVKSFSSGNTHIFLMTSDLFFNYDFFNA